MRLHFVGVPVLGGEAAEAELNRFLATHRVLSVERHLVADGGSSVWAVCVQYTPGVAKGAASPSKGKEAIDYREVLPKAQFEVYAQIRSLRNVTAKGQGVPPFALFNNAQLAEMVTRPVRSLEEMREIEGVGPGKIAKYGSLFLTNLEPLLPEGGW